MNTHVTPGYTFEKPKFLPGVGGACVLWCIPKYHKNTMAVQKIIKESWRTKKNEIGSKKSKENTTKTIVNNRSSTN